MIKERVLEYCKLKNMSLSRFEKLAGLSNGYFNQVAKRPSDSKLVKISAAHPDLNLAWLITGVGNMLEDDPASTDNSNHGNVTTIGDISGTTNSPTTVNNGNTAELMRVIETQREQIRAQHEQIQNLTDIIKNLTSK